MKFSRSDRWFMASLRESFSTQFSSLFFLITDLIHDIEGIAPIGVDRIIEAYRTLDRIQCV